jgi:hypothetical protein
MMRTVIELIGEQQRLSRDKKPYTLYLYRLDSGEEVESVQEFTIGERVTVWFDEQYNKSKLRRARSEYKEE